MKAANPQWGGRFKTGPSDIMTAINSSVEQDKNLWHEDIAASLAHCQMLADCHILTKKEYEEISAGLHGIAREIQSGNFKFSDALEDIHMNVEARLCEKIGDVGKKLHTARSRNDQVATDFKLWTRKSIDHLHQQIILLMEGLSGKALAYFDAPMPGFTHLQTAQPITFGHHLLAYVEMFNRDQDRLKDARKRLNECPLGSAALAGTSFPINRDLTAKLLKFDRPTSNSIDSVSDRDFALEYLSVLSITAVHLSRMAEEMVIWCSAPFHFIQFSDSFSTGSSIMPQKRNPDAAELVRGKTGQVFGQLMALLTVMKGLPLAYAKDMQEDKPPVFAATQAIMISLAAMDGMIRDMKPNREKMRQLAGSDYSTATDLADWLVRTLQIPFRKAHEITGEIVSLAEKKHLTLSELDLSDMQKIEPAITKDVYSVLSVDASLSSRQSKGGTSPQNVKKEAQKWQAHLKNLTL